MLCMVCVSIWMFMYCVFVDGTVLALLSLHVCLSVSIYLLMKKKGNDRVNI